MLLLDAPLTFQEYMTREALPLASIFREVFAILADRDDAVVFGSQAVNAYCDPPRMTSDLDVLASDAESLAEEIRSSLAKHFHIATRSRQIHAKGFRVYQKMTPPRHLVDVRQVDDFPDTVTFEGVLVVAPVDLLVMKVRSLQARKHEEKGLTDRLDIHRLLNRFPALRTLQGPIDDRLNAADARLWHELVREKIAPSKDDW